MKEMQPRSGESRLTNKLAHVNLPRSGAHWIDERRCRETISQNDSPFQPISVAGSRQIGLISNTGEWMQLRFLLFVGTVAVGVACLSGPSRLSAQQAGPTPVLDASA